MRMLLPVLLAITTLTACASSPETLTVYETRLVAPPPIDTAPAADRPACAFDPEADAVSCLAEYMVWGDGLRDRLEICQASHADAVRAAAEISE